MDSTMIAITGTLTSIGVIYGTYVAWKKRQLDSSDSNRKSDIDEFGALLQGYKDLKNEYEEQVKQLRKENSDLHDEVANLKEVMRTYERRLKDFENKQRTLKKEVKEL